VLVRIPAANSDVVDLGARQRDSTQERAHAQREARLARIKAALDDGTYAVDPWAIAHRLLRTRALERAQQG